MKFNYTNNLDDAIRAFVNSDTEHRLKLDKPPLMLTQNFKDMFYEAIDAYEDCLIQLFKEFHLPIKFLVEPLALSINDFPWIFIYTYGDDALIDCSIGLDGSINVYFNILKGKFTEDNVTYWCEVKSQTWRGVDFSGIPTKIVTHRLDHTNTRFPDYNIYFQLNHRLASFNLQKLSRFHNFIEREFPELRKLDLGRVIP